MLQEGPYGNAKATKKLQAAGSVLPSVVHYTLGDGEVMGTLWFLIGCAVVLQRQFTKQPDMSI